MRTDLISRHKLYTAIRRQPCRVIDDREYILRDAVLEKINIAPSVDAVEVVRCRECEHYRNKSCPMRALSLMPAGRLQVVDNTYENGFCHMGAKKGGGEVCG